MTGAPTVNEAPEKPPRKWASIVGVVAVACLGVWALQLLWNSPTVVRDPPRTDQSVVPDRSIDSRTLPSEDGVLDELMVDTDAPLVSLLDE